MLPGVDMFRHRTKLCVAYTIDFAKQDFPRGKVEITFQQRRHHAALGLGRVEQ